MRRKLFGQIVLLCLLAVTASAQAVDNFEGKVKVESAKFSAVKKIALVDVAGETKLSAKQTQPWTEQAFQQLVDGLKKQGYEVVMGPQVREAFAEIAPVPTYDDIKKYIIEKKKMSEADMERSAKFWSERYEKSEPYDSSKIGFTRHRIPNTINLERPEMNQKNPFDPDNADDKEIQRRIAALTQKLGVDALARVEFGFGSWHYEDPAWLKQAKARGATPGILPMIDEIKGTLKGTQATAFINMEIYDTDGKKKIVTVQGSCKSKEGTGLSILKINSKVEKMMPSTAEGCVQKVLEQVKKKS